MVAPSNLAGSSGDMNILLRLLFISYSWFTVLFVECVFFLLFRYLFNNNIRPGVRIIA